jgi:hypothetical protein
VQNPVVQNNAALGWAKSMEKLRISTVFSGFCAFIADFGPKLQVFGLWRSSNRGKPAKNQAAAQLNADRKEPFS